MINCEKQQAEILISFENKCVKLFCRYFLAKLVS